VAGDLEITYAITRLVFQLAILLVAAKTAGEVFERYLRQPGVLGELIAGMVIGPFALGGLSFFGLPPLFPPAGGGPIPVSDLLYTIAQIGAIVLLFYAGLETDLHQFLKFGIPSFAVALGGVIFPFVLGYWVTSLYDGNNVHALFMGAILTATSVGITARVLSGLKRLNTSEGVVILAAAVIDDVLGILVLTVVVSAAAAGSISLGVLAAIGAKAFLFWLGLLAFGIRFSSQISRVLSSFRSEGATLALAVALCFAASAAAEMVGLAMIIGAYTVGLALSDTEIAGELHRALYSLYHVTVPIFFVTMGMLVNLGAMKGALTFALIVSFLAVVGKLLGCGLPALSFGFNRLGALRIGAGMIPRGEVALIIAAYALAREAISVEMYGVAILMTAVTTLFTPPFLVRLFREETSGRETSAEPSEPVPDSP
jgi:Kef-type K+ transport system membrane component KefB